MQHDYGHVTPLPQDVALWLPLLVRIIHPSGPCEAKQTTAITVSIVVDITVKNANMNKKADKNRHRSKRNCSSSSRVRAIACNSISTRLGIVLHPLNKVKTSSF